MLLGLRVFLYGVKYQKFQEPLWGTHYHLFHFIFNIGDKNDSMRFKSLGRKNLGFFLTTQKGKNINVTFFLNLFSKRMQSCCVKKCICNKGLIFMIKPSIQHSYTAILLGDYCMSKESWHFFYSELPYEMGQDFLDIQYEQFS